MITVHELQFFCGFCEKPIVPSVTHRGKWAFRPEGPGLNAGTLQCLKGSDPLDYYRYHQP